MYLKLVILKVLFEHASSTVLNGTDTAIITGATVDILKEYGLLIYDFKVFFRTYRKLDPEMFAHFEAKEGKSMESVESMGVTLCKCCNQNFGAQSVDI